MKLFYKLERRFGRFAIPNLMYYIIILYIVGTLVYLVNPLFYYAYLSLDAQMLLRGQIWRIVTFMMLPPGGSNIFFNILALYLYYMLGMNLERAWGAFRFNFYFFTGILGHILAAIVLWVVFDQRTMMGTEYLNLSLFFAFVTMYPDIEFLLMFVIPVKAKWLGIANGALFLYAVIFGALSVKVSAILSLANFLIFFLMTRNYQRVNPKEVKRKAVFKTQVKVSTVGKTRHKCVVCGRTEKDGDDLEFRYCTKCEGNYEYCMDHLYTHKHVTKDE